VAVLMVNPVVWAGAVVGAAEVELDLVGDAVAEAEGVLPQAARAREAVKARPPTPRVRMTQRGERLLRNFTDSVLLRPRWDPVERDCRCICEVGLPHLSIGEAPRIPCSATQSSGQRLELALEAPASRAPAREVFGRMLGIRARLPKRSIRQNYLV
jgi:hypothetical protein